MKLDVNVLRYMTKEEFRVLTAVEMGQKNHEIVPSELVDRIAGLKRGGAFKNMRTLLRHKLVHHESKQYDGYRLTNLGYDYLAIKTLVNRGLIQGLGRQIGVGKESDIFEVVGENGETMALKLHRLGRTSFRAVKSKRDYLQHRQNYSWLYLSRLAALKEYAFMKALGENGFPVPRAVDWNRHCVLMSLVPGYPMVQVKEINDHSRAYSTIMGLVVKLAEHGLIHCDFNEFNLLIDDEENITMIDFPQMVSTSHKNAQMYFERDTNCIRKFFGKRFNWVPEEPPEGPGVEWPRFADVAVGGRNLDTELAASGFTKENQEQLEQAQAEAEPAEEGDDDAATSSHADGLSEGDRDGEASASEEASSSGSDETDSGAEDERKVGEKGRYTAALRRAKLKARAREKEGPSRAVGAPTAVKEAEVSAEGYGENSRQDGEGLGANGAAAGPQGLGIPEVGRGLAGLQVAGADERADVSGQSEAETESGSEGEASVAPSTAGGLDMQTQRRLSKQRKRAAASVKASGGKGSRTRNASKDKGGRRTARCGAGIDM